ncbi:hypothetical protein GGR51DRAFT_552921 [Nemania sp. FL0031]|nr:hypothetical protein GGR51DRAFT_552921 [Nemania sp. FL0031]
MQKLANELIPDNPLYMTFHDGQVHDPLDVGTYVFQNDILDPVLQALLEDEYGDKDLEDMDDLPSLPIVIHASIQPNNSPHVGTLIVLCCAFAVAKEFRDLLRMIENDGKSTPPPVTVLVTFIDTAPVKDEGIEVDEIQYQRSHRDVRDALSKYMPDYEEVIRYLSAWTDIPVKLAFQEDFFSNPQMPMLLNYVIKWLILGYQFLPTERLFALRSACPVPGCGLTDKHGRRDEYKADRDGQDCAIIFHCPHHGPHTVRISHPAEVARLEADAPARNLLRSMTHLLDTTTHHICVTGADYAGPYQEMLLYRHLAVWSANRGIRCRPPHIVYAPLVVDWSGAKLSKSVYARDGAYEFMKHQGMDGLCSYARLREQFGGDGAKGLRRIWDEMQRWIIDPKKLLRSFSVAYLHDLMFQDVKN